MVIAAKKTSQVILHMGVAFGVMYVMTGSMAFGGLAAIIEPICNVLLMPLHDRLWERIENSRSPHALRKTGVSAVRLLSRSAG